MAACVGALAVREVALCVTGGHFFAVTLYYYFNCYHFMSLVSLFVVRSCQKTKRMIHRLTDTAYCKLHTSTTTTRFESRYTVVLYGTAWLSFRHALAMPTERSALGVSG